MDKLPDCPKYHSDGVYEDGLMLVCTMCAHSGTDQVSKQAASLHRIHTDHNASMSQFDQIPPLVHLRLKYLKCSLPHHNLS